MTERLDIAEALKRAGLVAVQPRKRAVWVVTDQPPKKTESGLLWLPPEMEAFYYFVPHLRLVKATVVGVGPDVPYLNGKQVFQVGDRVGFPRTWFARYQFLGEEMMMGWLDYEKVGGLLQEALPKVKHEPSRAAPEAGL